MNTKAIFLGVRKLQYEEKTNEQGAKIPAFNGWQYSFYGNDWQKDLVLKQNGTFLNMVKKADEEQPTHLKVGEFYDLTITNLESRKCVLAEDEETDTVELPY